MPGWTCWSRVDVGAYNIQESVWKLNLKSQDQRHIRWAGFSENRNMYMHKNLVVCITSLLYFVHMLKKFQKWFMYNILQMPFLISVVSTVYCRIQTNRVWKKKNEDNKCIHISAAAQLRVIIINCQSLVTILRFCSEINIQSPSVLCL